MARFGYYFILTVFFMLGFAVFFQQLFQVAQRQLMSHHELQHAKLEFTPALFACLLMIVIRLLSANMTGTVYWMLINLNLLVINYSVIILESKFSFILLTITNGIVLIISAGIMVSLGIWVAFAAVMALFYVQHLRIRQFDKHPFLYVIFPTLIGPIVWWGFMVQVGRVYKLSWFQTGTMMGSYAVAMIVAVLYTVYVHHVRQIDSKFAKEAKYDGLTGFKNWNAFRVEFETYFRRAREHTGLSIATIDIDKFKAINDQYGHLAGNRALISFANCIVQTQKQQGIACENYRTGGEEFTVIFPGMAVDQAQRYCDDWQNAIRQMTVHYGKEQIKMTISVGLTEVKSTDRTATHIFQRADQNLYQSKRQGRDRLTVG